MSFPSSQGVTVISLGGCSVGFVCCEIETHAAFRTLISFLIVRILITQSDRAPSRGEGVVSHPRESQAVSKQCHGRSERRGFELKALAT